MNSLFNSTSPPTQIHPEPFYQRSRTNTVLLDGRRVFQPLVYLNQMGHWKWMNAEKCRCIWQLSFGKRKDCYSVEWWYYFSRVMILFQHHLIYFTIFLFPLQISWYNPEQCSTRLVCSRVSFSRSGRRHSWFVWCWGTGVPGSKLECSNSWHYCHSLLYVHRIWWNCSSVSKTEDKIS